MIQELNRRFKGVLSGQMYFDADGGQWYKYNGTAFEQCEAPSPEEIEALEQSGIILH